MNLRHAAVLAVMGWYLMVPPHSVWPRNRLDFSAPISQWTIIQSFETATACEDCLQEQKEEATTADPWFPKFPTKHMTLLQERVARCIFSDNPRLKP
jgi:hypothetical protein